MARRSYTVLLEPDPDRGGYTVTVPAIPEVVTEGDDEAHALAMAGEAVRLYLAYAADKGLPIPMERAGLRLATIDVEASAPVGVGA